MCYYLCLYAQVFCLPVSLYVLPGFLCIFDTSVFSFFCQPWKSVLCLFCLLHTAIYMFVLFILSFFSVWFLYRHSLVVFSCLFFIYTSICEVWKITWKCFIVEQNETIYRLNFLCISTRTVHQYWWDFRDIKKKIIMRFLKKSFLSLNRCQIKIVVGMKYVTWKNHNAYQYWEKHAQPGFWRWWSFVR